MRYFIHLLFITLFTISITSVFAQGPALSIKGVVVEETSNQAMEYCTVSLFKTGEDAPTTGTISGLDGSFVLDKLMPGSYTMKVSFIGFQEKVIENLTLNKQQPIVDAGRILLSPEAEQIEAVEIAAERSTVKYAIDKKIITVDKQLVASNGNATDVLATVPSIQVDINGDVKMRGKSSFSVLINGRPSVLSANDALKQIPASNIENIEIITNPSAKYDAEGSGGIINIILKEERDRGLSGVVNARYGTFKNYGGSADLSYNRDRITITASGNINQYRMANDNFVTTTNTVNGDDFVVEADGEEFRAFRNGRIKAGIEIRPNKKNTIGLQGMIGTWNMFVDESDDFLISDPDALYNEYANVNDTERGSKFYRVAGDYTLKMSEKSEIKFHAAYNRSFFKEEVINFQSVYDLNYDGGLSTEEGPSSRFRGNIDYTYKVNDSTKFELGFQQELGKSDEESDYFDYDATTDDYVLQNQFGQDVVYTKNIRAFYGIFSSKYKKLGYQVGVRSEFTDRSVIIEETDSETNILRTDLFPSVYLSYDLNQNNQLFINYSKRINRPRPWYIEPNPIYLNANTLFVGDPDILPTYTHSFEAGWLRYLKKKGSYNIQAYYQYEQNTIEFISTPFSENESIMQPTNVGEVHYVGIEQGIQFNIFKWWEMNVGMDIAYFRLIADVKGFTRNTNNVSGRGNINNFFTITKSTKAQFDFRYEGRQANAAGYTRSNTTFSLGLRQSFFKNALTLRMQWQDIFNTSQWTTFTDLPNFYQKSEMDPRYPKINFSIGYTINNYRAKRGTYDEGGGEF